MQSVRDTIYLLTLDSFCLLGTLTLISIVVFVFVLVLVLLGGLLLGRSLVGVVVGVADVFGVDLPLILQLLVDQVRHDVFVFLDECEVLGQVTGPRLATRVEELGVDRFPPAVDLFQGGNQVLELDVSPRFGLEDEVLLHAVDGKRLLDLALVNGAGPLFVQEAGHGMGLVTVGGVSFSAFVVVF